MNTVTDATSILRHSKHYALTFGWQETDRFGKIYTGKLDAVQQIQQLEMSDDRYITAIEELIGCPLIASHRERLMTTHRGFLAKRVFGYLVQNIIKAEEIGEYSLEGIVVKSIDQATKLLTNNDFIMARPEGTEPKVNEDGTMAAKKGDKKAIAVEWYAKNKDRIFALPKEQQRKTAIKELVEAAGMTDAGASTYWQNLKAGKL